MAIGIKIPLPLLLSCKSPTARGPFIFFFGFLSSEVFSSGVSCGRLSCGICAAPRGLTAPKNVRMTMTAAPNLRYKDFLDILDMLDIGNEALMSINVNDKAPEFTLQEKNMYGKKVMGIVRTTFIIGPDGKIQHIFPKVKAEGHAGEVLGYLKESGKGAA